MKRLPKKLIRQAPSRSNFTKQGILYELRALADPRVRAKLAHFNIHVADAHGISAPKLHALARRIGRNHALAVHLWATGNHEAKCLAALIDEPARVTASQMDRWARGFDSWDVVDTACCYLFVHAAPAWKKTAEWSRRKEEFIKRAAFSLVAYLAYKDKTAPDAKFLRLLEIIRRESRDDRNFVKKAVNWALRNIGKRNRSLNRAALRTAREIRSANSGASQRTTDAAAARWIAADALRELTSPSVQRRLRK
ncbi:MAG TPA: DNA alkylation repair protein [Candidatus Acidoferrum sp.]|nr:DNA alkylation repair protein [Candidatus Acidoferrum sp.]